MVAISKQYWNSEPYHGSLPNKIRYGLYTELGSKRPSVDASDTAVEFSLVLEERYATIV